MKWISTFPSKRYKFEIIKEECRDSVTGELICLYTFYANDSEDIDDRDYQQDDLDMAKRSANSHFDIPLDSWQQVDKP